MSESVQEAPSRAQVRATQVLEPWAEDTNSLLDNQETQSRPATMNDRRKSLPDVEESEPEIKIKGVAGPGRKRSGKELWALLRRVWGRYAMVTGRLKGFLEAGLKAREQLEQASKSSDKTRSVLEEGDLDFYDLKKLEERDNLKRHPLLKMWIMQHWERVDKDSSGNISKPVFCDLFLAFHRELLPDAPLRAAQRAVLKDWDSDSKGRESLSHGDFYFAFFELIDNWCETTQVREYVNITKRLLQAATESGAGVNVSPYGWYGKAPKSKAGKKKKTKKEKATPSKSRRRRHLVSTPPPKQEEPQKEPEPKPQLHTPARRPQTASSRVYDTPHTETVRRPEAEPVEYVTWTGELSSIRLVQGYGAPKPFRWGKLYEEQPKQSKRRTLPPRPQTAKPRMRSSFKASPDQGKQRSTPPIEFDRRKALRFLEELIRKEQDSDGQSASSAATSMVQSRVTDDGHDEALHSPPVRPRAWALSTTPLMDQKESPSPVRDLSALMITPAASGTTKGGAAMQGPTPRSQGKDAPARASAPIIEVPPPSGGDLLTIAPMKFNLKGFYDEYRPQDAVRRQSIHSPKSAFSPRSDRTPSASPSPRAKRERFPQRRGNACYDSSNAAASVSHMSASRERGRRSREGSDNEPLLHAPAALVSPLRHSELARGRAQGTAAQRTRPASAKPRFSTGSRHGAAQVAAAALPAHAQRRKGKRPQSAKPRTLPRKGLALVTGSSVERQKKERSAKEVQFTKFWGSTPAHADVEVKTGEGTQEWKRVSQAWDTRSKEGVVEIDRHEEEHGSRGTDRAMAPSSRRPTPVKHYRSIPFGGPSPVQLQERLAATVTPSKQRLPIVQNHSITQSPPSSPAVSQQWSTTPTVPLAGLTPRTDITGAVASPGLQGRVIGGSRGGAAPVKKVQATVPRSTSHNRDAKSFANFSPFTTFKYSTSSRAISHASKHALKK